MLFYLSVCVHACVCVYVLFRACELFFYVNQVLQEFIIFLFSEGSVPVII